jgi:hypothetical protein
MSPFAVVVIFILAILFAVLSLVPFLSGPADMESFEAPQKTKPNAAH